MFSGIAAPEVAMPWVDWRWCAEIEKFPCRVLAHRHPGIPNLGDVTAPDFIDRAKSRGPIDLLVFGSPCQAFSVAGLRKSLADRRGSAPDYRAFPTIIWRFPVPLTVPNIAPTEIAWRGL